MGVVNGAWEYHDADRGDEGWATAARGSARSYRIAGDTYLHPVGSAPEPEFTAVAGDDDTGLDFAGGDGAGSGATSVEATGTTQHALDQALQQAAEKPGARVTAVLIVISENGNHAGNELGRLVACLTTPPLAGAELHLAVKVVTQLERATDSLRIEFSGSATEWQPLRQAVHTITTDRAAGVDGSITATFIEPITLDSPLIADLTAQAADVGPARATVRLSLEPTA